MANRFASDNLHSRVVMILKITLPLVALAILASLFLFSAPIDPEDAIPYADVEIADRLAQPRMTGAGFSTVTSDGATLTLSAEAAVPKAGGATVTGLSGLLQSPDGASTQITAAKAELDRTKGQLQLTEGVTLQTSQGYAIRTDAVNVATDRTAMESPGPVEATAPMGELTSGRVQMTIASDGKTYLLVFNKGVRLLYQPKH